MHSLKFVVIFLLVLITSACSSSVNKEYAVIERDSEKRAFISDHHLKMSLLNRPIPQDQLMMLAFAKNQALRSEQYLDERIAKVNYVAIRGDSVSDPEAGQSRKVNNFVGEDLNAISVLGPK